MAVITLTTEWRQDDFYNGIMKGRLCSLAPGATIIDNANNIPVFNLGHASFIIRNTFQNYPEGSVHIICVHSEAKNNSGYLLVKARNHYFIGTDNGIFNLILNSPPEEIISLDPEGYSDEIELFASTAAALVSGKGPELLGTRIDTINEKMPLRATIDKDVITGSILFIDSYGNAISNITRDVFYRVFEKRDFVVLIQSNRNRINRICERYSDEPVGELLARFNSLDLLEIAINGTNVAELLSITVGSVVRVDLAAKTPGSGKIF
jgi:S-adenosylmethionine hydrolase